MTRDEQVEAALELGGKLGRRDHLGMFPEPEHPGDQLALVRVLGAEEPVSGPLDRGDLAEAAKMALELPRDALGHTDLGGPDDLAELPWPQQRICARVEVRRA